MMISRVGGPGTNPILWGNKDSAIIFGDMVCYGYVYILLIQMVGIVLGDRAPVQVG